MNIYFHSSNTSESLAKLAGERQGAMALVMGGISIYFRGLDKIAPSSNQG